MELRATGRLQGGVIGMIAALGFCLIALAPAAMAAERTVAVEASATLKVPNDSASVGLSVSLERGTRGAALQAVSAKLGRVIATAQTIPGVGDGDVRTGRVSVRKSFRGNKPSYRASEGIGVTLHQPDKAGELISAAISAGATGVSGPNYFVGDTEAASTKALTAAFEKAKVRATALAGAAGATLGQTLSIDEGGGAEFVPSPDAKAAPEAGCLTATAPPGAPVKRATAGACAGTPPPSKPGTSTVSATVRVVFALQ
ncbi:MAG: SIMPL domain-containing protein [Solirubrobacterales bacterium]